jgi:hypothetical protein
MFFQDNIYLESKAYNNGTKRITKNKNRQAI